MIWCLTALAVGPAIPVRGDAVWVRDSDGETQRRGGDIVDFRADVLTLRRSSARTERIPTDRIVRWQTSLSGAHQRADRAFDAHDWQTARAAYEEAMRRETREWLQRYQLARIIWCERNLGDDLSAARHFMILTRNDGTMLYLDAAPLHWRSKPLAGGERQWALEHLHDQTYAVSRLIAASWLLAGAERGDALAELQKLTRSSEERIALLATMQQWRSQADQLKRLEPNEARQRLERLPESLRRGGCFVLGQASQQAGDSKAATQWYLRMALLYPHDARLAPISLWRAADLLQAGGKYDEAKRLLFELSDRYPRSVESQHARERLNRTKPKEGDRQ